MRIDARTAVDGRRAREETTGRTGFSLIASPLQRVAAGDATAVRDVLDAYGGMVWSLARRATLTRGDAEDAVQDIFFDVWRAAPRFDPEVASEATFVAMIARRRLIDRQRRASRRRESPLAGAEPGAQADGESPSRPALDPEEAKMAARAIEALGPDQQQALRLGVIHGLSHESIATATGLPIGTVKTHIRRGLIRIRQMLQEARAAQGLEVGR